MMSRIVIQVLALTILLGLIVSVATVYESNVVEQSSPVDNTFDDPVPREEFEEADRPPRWAYTVPTPVEDIYEYVREVPRDIIVPLKAENDYFISRDVQVDFSTTNVQVSGVDEPDWVKTDGEYIYLIAEGEGYSRAVKIIDANTLEELATIDLGSRYPNELLLYGDKLIIFSTDSVVVKWLEPARLIYPFEWSTPRSHIDVYDVSNPSEPRFEINIYVEGGYVSARRIDNYLYVTFNIAPIFTINSTRTPIVSVNGSESLVIDYPTYDLDGDFHRKKHSNGVFILAVRLYDYRVEGILTLSIHSRDIYVSREGIYIIGFKNVWGVWLDPTDVGERLPSPHVAISKIRFLGLNMEPVATVFLEGFVRDRLNLDEYNGFLRVGMWRWIGLADQSETLIYILDDQLNVVSYVGGMGKGEQLYGIRFLGDYAYLVTFRTIDPFYVVDLSNPFEPKVLGELKVTGFSNLLQPITMDRVLGIGYEADEQGRIEGIKVSLYDVSNPLYPEELDRIFFTNMWSEALDNIRALTIDWSRGEVYIPFIRWGISGETVEIKIYLVIYRLDEDRLEKIEFRSAFNPKESGQSIREWIYVSGKIRTLYIGDLLFLVNPRYVAMVDRISFEIIQEVTITS